MDLDLCELNQISSTVSFCFNSLLYDRLIMVSLFHYSKLDRFQKIATEYSSPLVAFFHINQLFSRPITSLNVSPPLTKQKLEDNNNINNKGSSAYIVSYLINSCGLSPESAKSTSKKVNFKTLENPNSVLELLKNHGFDKTQISNIVKRRPTILSADPKKTLLPKMDFFYSVGVPKADVARVFSSNPSLLASSLENRIIPFYEFIKSVLGDDNLVAAVMKCPKRVGPPKYITDNVLYLKEIAVPQENIVLVLTNFPEITMQKHEKLRKIVVKVKEMGFDPLKTSFLFAIRVLGGKGSKLIWDRCFNMYKKWGWSEDDILSAFKKHPYCMTFSENKIEKTMDFLVNKMRCQGSEIAKMSIILSYSLENRMIPRCSVIRILSFKGLVKDMSLQWLLCQSNKHFLERFVTRYDDQFPQLMNVYQGKLPICNLDGYEW